jgi:hypothetical protein
MPFNRKTIFDIAVPIKVALVQAKMFQRDAAKQLGISMTTFNMKLLGRRKWTEDEQQRLSKILGKDLQDLFPEHHTSSEENTQNKKCITTPPPGAPESPGDNGGHTYTS